MPMMSAADVSALLYFEKSSLCILKWFSIKNQFAKLSMHLDCLLKMLSLALCHVLKEQRTGEEDFGLHFMIK